MWRCTCAMSSNSTITIYGSYLARLVGSCTGSVLIGVVGCAGSCPEPSEVARPIVSSTLAFNESNVHATNGEEGGSLETTKLMLFAMDSICVFFG